MFGFPIGFVYIATVLPNDWALSNGYWYAGYHNITNGGGILYSNESTVNPSAVLTQARYYATGMGMCSDLHGYFGDGGNSGMADPINSDINRLAFSTVTMQNLSVKMRTNTCAYASFRYYNIKGYWLGGQVSHAGADTARIESMTYATTAQATLTATLVTARRGLLSTFSATRGYGMSGQVGATPNTEVDGILFSNESQINPASTLSGYSVGISWSTPTVGYFGITTSITSFSYATESFTAKSATLSYSVTNNPSAVVSNTKGYSTIGGGVNNTNGFIFSSETIANPTVTIGGSGTSSRCGIQG